MDFSYNDEQQMLRDSVAKFIQQHYSFETRRKNLSDNNHSAKHWQTFAELGWLMMLFKEEDGGLGGSAVDIVALMEELGKGIVVEPIIATAILAGGLIAKLGNTAQKQTLLEPLMQGQLQLAFAYAEPQSRYQLNVANTTATKTNNGFVINGHKAVVLNAANADFIVASVRTSGNEDDHNGISLLLVAKDSPGLTIQSYPTVDGFQAGEVIFKDVSVDASNVLGKIDEALPTIEAIIDTATLAICAEAVGAMEVAYKKTVEYSKTRKQFGVPIGSFQALQHRMADMFMEHEQAKSILLMAAMKCDAINGVDSQAISAAKSRISKAARRIGQESVQIHGGIGVTDELDVAHYFKRLTTFQFMFGSSDYHSQRYTTLSRKSLLPNQ